MNFLPLCTASVCPTISGMTVERRDQVLMTFFSEPRFITSIFSRSEVSTNGPFLSERLIIFDFDLHCRTMLSGCWSTTSSIDHHRSTMRYFCRRWTMNWSVRFWFRVLYPLVGRPHGETG